jgi:hypothetical protein
VKFTKDIQLTEKRATKVTCDICGMEAPRPSQYGSNWKDGTDWSSSEATTSVSILETENYPEYKEITKREYDICHECFKKHIITLIDSLAVSSEKGGEKDGDTAHVSSM